MTTRNPVDWRKTVADARAVAQQLRELLDMEVTPTADLVIALSQLTPATVRVWSDMRQSLPPDEAERLQKSELETLSRILAAHRRERDPDDKKN